LILKKGKWIVKILNNYSIKINPPSSITSWKPIVVTIAAIAGVCIVAYALSRLKKV